MLGFLLIFARSSFDSIFLENVYYYIFSLANQLTKEKNFNKISFMHPIFAYEKDIKV